MTGTVCVKTLYVKFLIVYLKMNNITLIKYYFQKKQLCTLSKN